MLHLQATAMLERHRFSILQMIFQLKKQSNLIMRAKLSTKTRWCSSKCYSCPSNIHQCTSRHLLLPLCSQITGPQYLTISSICRLLRISGIISSNNMSNIICSRWKMVMAMSSSQVDCHLLFRHLKTYFVTQMQMPKYRQISTSNLNSCIRTRLKTIWDRYIAITRKHPTKVNIRKIQANSTSLLNQSSSVLMRHPIRSLKASRIL